MITLHRDDPIASKWRVWINPLAEGLLEIYIGANALAVALFATGGVLLMRRNRPRGALIGLVLGVLIGPIIINLLFFDVPEAHPIPKIIVGQ